MDKWISTESICLAELAWKGWWHIPHIHSVRPDQTVDSHQTISIRRLNACIMMILWLTFPSFEVGRIGGGRGSTFYILFCYSQFNSAYIFCTPHLILYRLCCYSLAYCFYFLGVYFSLSLFLLCCCFLAVNHANSCTGMCFLFQFHCEIVLKGRYCLVAVVVIVVVVVVAWHVLQWVPM